VNNQAKNALFWCDHSGTRQIWSALDIAAKARSASATHISPSIAGNTELMAPIAEMIRFEDNIMSRQQISNF
jgi:hypothetical protein